MSLLCLAIFCALSQVCRAQHLRNSSSTHTGQLPRPSVRPNTTEREVSHHLNIEHVQDPSSSAAELARQLPNLAFGWGQSDTANQTSEVLKRIRGSFKTKRGEDEYFVEGIEGLRWFFCANFETWERVDGLKAGRIVKTNVHKKLHTSASAVYHTSIELVQQLPLIAALKDETALKHFQTYNIWYWLLGLNDPDPDPSTVALIFSFIVKKEGMTAMEMRRVLHDYLGVNRANGSDSVPIEFEGTRVVLQ